MRGQFKQASRALMQGQVPGIELAVVREVSRDFETLTYTIGATFIVRATRKGVTFAGSSNTFSGTRMRDVLRFIHYASTVAQELASERGIPPQDELTRILRLKTRKMPVGYTAWFAGFRNLAVSADSEHEAVRSLRYNWRIREHATVAEQLPK